MFAMTGLLIRNARMLQPDPSNVLSGYVYIRDRTIIQVAAIDDANAMPADADKMIDAEG